MRAKMIKLKKLNKNKRHNDLGMKCKETRTTHSRDRCLQPGELSDQKG